MCYHAAPMETIRNFGTKLICYIINTRAVYVTYTSHYIQTQTLYTDINGKHCLGRGPGMYNILYIINNRHSRSPSARRRALKTSTAVGFAKAPSVKTTYLYII